LNYHYVGCYPSDAAVTEATMATSLPPAPNLWPPVSSPWPAACLAACRTAGHLAALLGDANVASGDSCACADALPRANPLLPPARADAGCAARLARPLNDGGADGTGGGVYAAFADPSLLPAFGWSSALPVPPQARADEAGVGAGIVSVDLGALFWDDDAAVTRTTQLSVDDAHGVLARGGTAPDVAVQRRQLAATTSVGLLTATSTSSTSSTSDAVSNAGLATAGVAAAVGAAVALAIVSAFILVAAARRRHTAASSAAVAAASSAAAAAGRRPRPPPRRITLLALGRTPHQPSDDAIVVPHGVLPPFKLPPPPLAPPPPALQPLGGSRTANAAPWGFSPAGSPATAAFTSPHRRSPSGPRPLPTPPHGSPAGLNGRARPPLPLPPLPGSPSGSAPPSLSQSPAMQSLLQRRSSSVVDGASGASSLAAFLARHGRSPATGAPGSLSATAVAAVAAAGEMPLPTPLRASPLAGAELDGAYSTWQASSSSSPYRTSEDATRPSFVTARSVSGGAPLEDLHEEDDDGGERAAAAAGDWGSSSLSSLSTAPEDPRETYGERLGSDNDDDRRRGPARQLVVEPWFPQRFDELALSPGEEVVVHRVYEDGWCDGRVCGTGEEGVFPLACLACRDHVGGVDDVSASNTPIARTDVDPDAVTLKSPPATRAAPPLVAAAAGDDGGGGGDVGGDGGEVDEPGDEQPAGWRRIASDEQIQMADALASGMSSAESLNSVHEPTDGVKAVTEVASDADSAP
ncbi:hypothetical protein HK405_004076, partial [Cladochytrium tenue]